MLRTIGVGVEKLWLTLAICGGVILLRLALARIVRALTGARADHHVAFWIDQAASLAALVSVLVACVAIWRIRDQRGSGTAGAVPRG